MPVVINHNEKDMTRNQKAAFNTSFSEYDPRRSSSGVYVKQAPKPKHTFLKGPMRSIPVLSTLGYMIVRAVELRDESKLCKHDLSHYQMPRE